MVVIADQMRFYCRDALASDETVLYRCRWYSAVAAAFVTSPICSHKLQVFTGRLWPILLYWALQV